MEGSIFPPVVRVGGVKFILDHRDLCAAAFRFAKNRFPTVEELDRTTLEVIGDMTLPGWAMFLKIHDEPPKPAEEVPPC